MEAARQPSRTEKASEGGLQSSREGSGIGHSARYKRRKLLKQQRVQGAAEVSVSSVGRSES